MSTPTNPPAVTVDQQVLDLFNSVRAKQRDLAAASQAPRWKTTCTIGKGGTDTVKDRVNIQTVTDAAVLIDLYGFLLMQQDYWIKAHKVLSMTGEHFQSWSANVPVKPLPPFQWMGHSMEQWTADFRTALDQIGLKAKRADLKRLESRLDALITVEQRRSLELKAIQDEMAAAQ